MGKKNKSEPNRVIKLLIYGLFALICILFLYFAHRYYEFSRENEILRSDYQDFLRKAKDALSAIKNSTDQASAGVPVAGSSTGGIAVSPPPRTSSEAPDLPMRVVQSAQDTQDRQDIVIGMAQDIDPKNFAVFCFSFRRHSSAAAVIFANSPISDLIKEIARKNDVHLVEYELSKQPDYLRNYHASTLRWPFIYKFFESPDIRNKYRRVWMIDVRDSFFQADPFQMLPSGQSQFYAFKGVESKNIENCGWNSGWVKDCFGQQILSAIGSGSIICSGVSVGSMDVVWKYLQLMNSVVTGQAKGDIYPSSKFPECERNGVDQGVHNVLVHQNKIPKLKIWGQADGPVANMQAELYNLNLDKMEVRNKRGELVAVAHQYDRNQELQKKLFKQYVYWVDTSNPLAEWNLNSNCKKYDISPNKDLFKGICDFKTTGGATGPSTCCDVCASESRCRGFVFASGSCFYKVKCSQTRTNFPLPNGYSAYAKPEFE